MGGAFRIDDVRLVEGGSLGPARAVGVSDGRVVAAAEVGHADRVDGGGGVLVPGLVDAHVHVTEPDQLVEPGRRADLLLVGGDPTRDVAALADIRGVWVAGERVR